MNKTSNEMISAKIVSRSQRAQLGLSPWVRRLLHDPTGSVGNPARRHPMAISAGQTLSLLNRVQRQPERTVVWRPDRISVTPMLVDRFSEGIAQRYHYASIAVKPTPPPAEARLEIPLGTLPLAGQSASSPHIDHIRQPSPQPQSTPPRLLAKQEAATGAESPQLPAPKPHFMAQKSQDIRPSWLRNKPQPPKPTKGQSSTAIALQKMPASGQPAKVKPDPKNLRLFSQVEYVSDMGRMTPPPEIVDGPATPSKEQLPINQDAAGMDQPTPSSRKEPVQSSQVHSSVDLPAVEPFQPDEITNRVKPAEAEPSTRLTDSADFPGPSLPAKTPMTPQPGTSHLARKSASPEPIQPIVPDQGASAVPEKTLSPQPQPDKTAALIDQGVELNREEEGLPVKPPLLKPALPDHHPTTTAETSATPMEISPDRATPSTGTLEPDHSRPDLSPPPSTSSEKWGQTLINRVAKRQQMVLNQVGRTQPIVNQPTPTPVITPQQARTRLIKKGWRFKQKKADAVTNPGQVNRAMSRLEQPRGTGRPLPAEPRAKIENLLGRDFGQVRVQTASLGPLNIEAATKGPDIYVESGQDRFDTPQSLALLGHELTHVKQQNWALTKPLSPTPPQPHNDDKWEAANVAGDEAEAIDTEHQIQRQTDPAKSPPTIYARGGDIDRPRWEQPEPPARRPLIFRKSENLGGTPAIHLPQPQVAAVGVPAAVAEWLMAAQQAEQHPPVTPAPKQQIARQAEAPAPAVDAAEPGAAEAETDADEAVSAQPDLDQLARQILPLIKRLLKVDSERRPRSSDFGYR